MHIVAVAFDADRQLVSVSQWSSSCAPLRGKFATLPRPMAMAAQASSAV
jgi:hypothetical protein